MTTIAKSIARPNFMRTTYCKRGRHIDQHNPYQQLENPPLDVVDLVAELTSLTEQLGAWLHSDAAASLADMVRIMNCYYSNLIEGHNTIPRDIERALANELDNDQARRNLQIEARAHIRVQKLIDEMYIKDALPEPASSDFLQWLHTEFYRDASDEMLVIKQDQQNFKMVPGEFRSLTVHDVAVGRHLPPSSETVADFMRHFEQRYQFEAMGKGSRILVMAAAHHRLAYVHPFPDGNGRVCRLMSHAMGLKAGIGAFGLWSISRGLARGLNSRQEYKQMMGYADSPRQGDLDGRGNLSQKALTELSSATRILLYREQYKVAQKHAPTISSDTYRCLHIVLAESYQSHHAPYQKFYQRCGVR